MIHLYLYWCITIYVLVTFESHSNISNGHIRPSFASLTTLSQFIFCPFPEILSILYQAALLKFSSHNSHPFHQTLGTFCFNIRLFPNESFNSSRFSVVFYWKHPCSMKGTILVASTKKTFTLHNYRCSDEDAYEREDN